MNRPPPPPLDLARVQRFARHIALPEIGVQGQARLCQARALVVADGGELHAGASAAGDYLRAAGLAQVRLAPPFSSLADWLSALGEASIALRFGLDDDVMLTAAVRLGVPLVVARARSEGVDLLSFRRHGPCPHRELATTVFPAPVVDAGAPPPPGPAAVLAGTLAASEALLVLADPDAPPRARLLRLPLDGAQPVQAELPWAPECFLCGGHHQTASFS